jgi:hypothetical protein
MQTTYEMGKNCYDPCASINNTNCSEKELLISHLKSRLFQLDENEKNYCELLNKFRNLQNEYQLMNEAKIRLEYELRQKMSQIIKFYVN